MRILNNEAVSPTIGVILMVALTVILAVIVTSVSFSMNEETNMQKTPAFRATRINATHVALIVIELGGATSIKKVEISSPSGGVVDYSEWTSESYNLGKGNFTTLSNVNYPSKLVVSALVDGKRQVILEITL